MHPIISISRFLVRVVAVVAATVLVPVADAAPKPGAETAQAVSTLTPDAGRLVVDVKGTPPPVPVFFTAAVVQTVHFDRHEILTRATVTLHRVQGRPEAMSLGLAGDGEIVDVSGVGLQSWSVRRANSSLGRRWLDLHLAATAEDNAPRDWTLTVRARTSDVAIPGATSVLLLEPGDAVGFSSTVTLECAAEVNLGVTSAAGFSQADEKGGAVGLHRFVTAGEGRIEVALRDPGTALAEAALIGAELVGTIDEATQSASFRLRAQGRAHEAGARVRLLWGHAGLSEKAAGDGWHVEAVRIAPHEYGYDWVADRAGLIAIDVPFAAEVLTRGDWRTFDFAMPAGAVVPLQLSGLRSDVQFKADAPVVPIATPEGWRGFLPADGSAALAWKHAPASTEGKLFFSSSEVTDIRVGAGLLHERTELSVKVLQGNLAQLRCRLEGAGEILGVEGANVIGWKVIPDATGRVLDVQLSRPIEGAATWVVQSQSELGSYPARIEPLKLRPEGVVRHAGFLRLANQGAVRLEVAEPSGLMQLAPAQFPGSPVEDEHAQILVYRFPSADYAYRVVVTQIQPEVGVAQIATYTLGSTDRVIDADLELDIREAPLRDWSLDIPEDYSVVAVKGDAVSDYAAESAVANGYRRIKILFGEEVQGRQLIQVRLEKNESAAAGNWSPRPLQFPEAKNVRGHVGLVAAPGFRLTPEHVQELVEVPLAYFPRQVAGLQQAWRLRDGNWTAAVRVEALGQSIQADVFHLYSIRQGAVYGSVLVNYFVVGAPASEWRLVVPRSLGNVDVVGQNVRRDWHRDGDEIVVALHQPVLGAATLLVTFEAPLPAGGASIHPGEVHPVGVQSERGYIEVVSPSQVRHGVEKVEGGLLKLDPAELPTEYRLLASSPALAVYQYTARPIALDLRVDRFAPGDLVDQVVDFTWLFSHVSREGQVITDALYYVKTRGSKALRVALPGGVKLWECRVDGEIVQARVDGGALSIPLPAKPNPNDPAKVNLRLGQDAGADRSHVRLVAPQVGASHVVDEWILRGDAGRLLVPAGGNAELIQPGLTETGFEWISARARYAVVALLGLVALAAAVLRQPKGWRLGLGLLFCAVALALSALLMGNAQANRRHNLRELHFGATLVAPQDQVTIEVDNLTEGRAMIVGWGVAALGAGVVLLVAAALMRTRRNAAPKTSAALGVLGVVACFTGVLAQRGGAIVFFGAVGAGVFALMLIPTLVRWSRERIVAPSTPEAPGPGLGSVATGFLLVLAGLSAFGTRAHAQDASVAKKWIPARGAVVESVVQTWQVQDHRVAAELDLEVRGQAGESVVFLHAPAVLTDFKSKGLRVGKVERDGATEYAAALDRDGVWSARVRFELPVEDLSAGIPLPTVPAAVQRIRVERAQPGWSFASAAAVLVQPLPDLPAGRSGAILVLAPQTVGTIQLQPKARDTAAEATQFFAQVDNLFIPGPGVVNAVSRVTVRPVQGRVTRLAITVPAGLTVGDVGRGPVGTWRFDPQQRRLEVALEPAQSEIFHFDVETQVGAGALPFDFTLEPLRVEAAASDVGTLGLAFGGDAQAERVRPANVSAMNIQDFDTSLLPAARAGEPAVSLQSAWRYGDTGGHVELQVVPVAPEVRSHVRQVLTFDDDRLVMAVDLRVNITRVGLFTLSFPLPAGLELEALSGDALSQWTDTTEKGARLITLHLTGRTLGEHHFAMTFSGAAPHAQVRWEVPKLTLREATRQTGEVLFVPGKGIRLRAVDREQVTPLDPRSVGGLQPGALAFRLLAENWNVRLGIEALEPWVTLQALQETTLREGQTLTRLGLHYRVENAAVKNVRLKLPELTEEEARTVRASGTAVTEIVRAADQPGAWEIHFQHGIVGDAEVQIEYQRATEQKGADETIVPVQFFGVRQVQQFAAVRMLGRLEVEPAALPRGWSRLDWNGVPANVQNRNDRSVPALCYRIDEPDAGLRVKVRRDEIAELLKLRVTQANLTTLLSPRGEELTAMELKLDVTEKSTMRLRLPARALLFNTLVNSENVGVVRDGDAYLFHVVPLGERDRSATVRFVYATPLESGPKVALVAPNVGLPLQNVAWRLIVPPEYRLGEYAGGLRLLEERDGGAFSVEAYQSLVRASHSAETKKAVALLEEASGWLQRGDQQKAGEVLSRAAIAPGLDEASNEDARVQLRNLKTQQAVLGLNTRRQRLYLDNRVEAERNEQLEQAANLNPLMQGRVNFDPQQLDQLLMGNSVEETSALKGIAARIVDQQLATEPPPSAIDVTLPERGRIFTFARSLQVDGGAPLDLRVALEKIPTSNRAFDLLVLLGVGGIAGISFMRERRA